MATTDRVARTVAGKLSAIDEAEDGTRTRRRHPLARFAFATAASTSFGTPHEPDPMFGESRSVRLASRPLSEFAEPSVEVLGREQMTAVCRWPVCHRETGNRLPHSVVDDSGVIREHPSGCPSAYILPRVPKA
jgi:hypothetical protein